MPHADGMFIIMIHVLFISFDGNMNTGNKKW